MALAMADTEKTVLIVEDNELNMKLFNDLLDAHGYKTLQTRDGMEALDMAREHRPDLILMDIQLPDIDGYTALDRIRADERTAQIPVVALTALAMRTDRERIREAGFDGYLQKPISVRDFPTQVRRHLAEGRPGGPP